MSDDLGRRFQEAVDGAAKFELPPLLERLDGLHDFADDLYLDIRAALLSALLIGFRAGVIEATAQDIEHGIDVELHVRLSFPEPFADLAPQ